MAPKKSNGPSSFCEWVVGTTVESAMRSSTRKHRRRDVVRVEVSTDDESWEDTLRITYPRTTARPTAKKSSPATAAKKVRFEKKPPKSAMKKTTTTIATSESDPDTSESATGDSSASCEASGESSDE